MIGNRLAALALVLGCLLAMPPPARADSPYAPNATPEALARLRLRCHLSLTCPLSARDYAIFLRAMDGDHGAEVEMAEKLERGQGLPADRDAAVVWYGRAAEAGSVHAALQLNRLYRDGAALHSDDARIAASLEKLASGGNADAMRALADMYFYGRGVARDPHLAMTLLNQAASGGSTAATADIARLRQASQSDMR